MSDNPNDLHPTGWLVRNSLTPTHNDFFYENEHADETRTNTDIARSLVLQGLEYKEESVLAMANMIDEMRFNFLKQGVSVQTTFNHMSLRVHGAWNGENAKFDPAIHSVTIETSPTSAARAELAKIRPVVLGVKQGVAFIGHVSDLTSKSDTPPFKQGDFLEITGERIKVAPENEPGLGVFFVKPNTPPYPVTYTLLKNDPRTIIAQIPANLPDGDYTIRVVTKYSNHKQMLKEARTIDSSITYNIDDGEFGK
jgi:hypothetical protein